MQPGADATRADPPSGPPGSDSSTAAAVIADSPATPAETPPSDEPAHDRWHWRRRIRANPHQLFVYRIVIGILGLLCIAAGAITGPLPGPGGIPLVLLGLAIWASEFRWARRLMLWFKDRIRQVMALSPGRKVLFWILFACCCGLLGYLALLIVGIPPWCPAQIRNLLTLLPLVD